MKILTYNIMTAGKDLFPSKKSWWFTRTLQLIRMIKVESPDIFCLNEVTVLQKFMLLFLRGYRSKGGLTQNQVFWKNRIENKRVSCLNSKIELLKDTTKYFRSLTRVQLVIRDYIYTFISTHLDWDIEIHNAQKEQVIQSIYKWIDSPSFICGDFNVEKDNIRYFTATKPTEDTFCTGGKIDYIFNNLNIEKCAVLTQYKMSDHYPLIIYI